MWEILGIRDFPVFLVSAVVLALTPGQDSLFVLGRTLAQGRAAGLVSVAGILSGALVHLLAGACGLSALLAASPSAFTVVKWAGGSYLVYLGVRMLFSRSAALEAEQGTGRETLSSLWRQGFITNVLNPKVALFCLAFIPQFIVSGTARPGIPFMVLGLWFFAIGGLWLFAIVMGAAAIAGKLGRRSGWHTAFTRLAGLLFVGLGLRMLFQRLG